MDTPPVIDTPPADVCIDIKENLRSELMRYSTALRENTLINNRHIAKIHTDMVNIRKYIITNRRESNVNFKFIILGMVFSSVMTIILLVSLK